MRVAVIDLGTNLFNLTIAEKSNRAIKILHSDKFSVKLGRGGIGNNLILPDAIDRALTALTIHFQAIQSFKVDKILAMGTSALRTANNSNHFLTEVKHRFGFDIKIISGNREAELIYLGVRQTFSLPGEKFLILDIGGGSNEFIYADDEKMIWKNSFALGMARLLEQFKPSDPITKTETESLENHFTKELQPLFETLENKKINYLIGAEGAFETFYNILSYQNNPGFRPKPYFESKAIDIENFRELHQTLITTHADERSKIKGLEHFRTEMVVPASIFINFILEKLALSKLLVSPFSLKEGAAWELLYK